MLLQTQQKFISVLQIADGSPEGWKSVLAGSSLAPNLFLKHLMVLADVSGEILKRITPMREDKMVYVWQGQQHVYRFKSIYRQQVSNSKLRVDTRQVLQSTNLNDLMEDVIMFILFGGAAVNLSLPPDLQERCTIGGLLGNCEAIERFVRQRYIVVSAILGGATSNELGQEIQNYVQDFLVQRAELNGV